MFSGIITKKLSAVRIAAVTGAVVLLVSTILEMQGISFFNFNTRNMLVADNFSLLFMAVMFGAVVLYFLLSGKDIEKVGSDVAEYYALIFFVLAGVGIVSSFNSLLLLFLGIEIITIPLYILTGSGQAQP